MAFAASLTYSSSSEIGLPSSCSLRCAPRPADVGVHVARARPAVQFAAQRRPFIRWSCTAQATAAVGDSTPAPGPAEILMGDDARRWAEAAAAVLAAAPGLEASEVETAMKHAFGWTKRGWKYWRGEYKESAPPEGQVGEVLGMLFGELGLGSEEVADVVKRFPEVLGLSVEKRIRPALAELAKEKGVKEAEEVRATIARIPQVLGFNCDCWEECRGDCLRCWQQY